MCFLDESLPYHPNAMELIAYNGLKKFYMQKLTIRLVVALLLAKDN